MHRPRRGGRAVECGGLENCSRTGPRGPYPKFMRNARRAPRRSEPLLGGDWRATGAQDAPLVVTEMAALSPPVFVALTLVLLLLEGRA